MRMEEGSPPEGWVAQGVRSTCQVGAESGTPWRATATDASHMIPGHHDRLLRKRRLAEMVF